MPVIKATPLSGSSTVSGTSTISDDFKNLLFEFLETKGIEGLVPFVYNDKKGIPTLGVGYAMVVKNGAGQWVVRNYQEDFKKAGIDLSSLPSTLASDLQHAANALNDPNGGDTNPFKNDKNIYQWTITPDQAKGLFDVIAVGYVDQVKAWLGSSPAGQAAYDALFNGGAGSQELLALASQAYNGPALISPGHSPSLQKAILAGNRAEAWYQIEG